ncbi:MAG: hypothetical protein EDX89_22890 [Acidobacteria bacterium]|nr:MAG: hypothetical protein EDX89_22890 [Acidobacteriota bacterium]MCE7959544.1 hypothetical protein [Acidobacteria bacterium ACB2]
MGRPTLYNPDRHRSIVAAVRAGSFAWIAAEANGVSRTTFKTWLRKGERTRREPYRTFAADIRQARAQARLSAELEVRREEPFAWLRYGPGRERVDEPGWTESKEIKHSGSVDVIHSLEWARIASAIRAALEPFVEARLAVAEALDKIEATPTEETPLLPAGPSSSDPSEVP